jgi:hypothetical protein
MGGRPWDRSRRICALASVAGSERRGAFFFLDGKEYPIFRDLPRFFPKGMMREEKEGEEDKEAGLRRLEGG